MGSGLLALKIDECQKSACQGIAAAMARCQGFCRVLGFPGSGEGQADIAQSEIHEHEGRYHQQDEVMNIRLRAVAEGPVERIRQMLKAGRGECCGKIGMPLHRRPSLHRNSEPRGADEKAAQIVSRSELIRST